ncbi:hypothetical protein [Ottowia sp. VDI28]|uniref:hypothetical protein n=1 Tax=Ottowia sp. VDI28 TaxID=3133968 RepID=UPI003C2E0322
MHSRGILRALAAFRGRHGWVVVLAAVASPAAWAQSQPTGVTLACPGMAPGTGVQADLSTQPNRWGISTNQAPAEIAATGASDEYWGSIAGAAWIGDSTHNGAPSFPTAITYSLKVTANDPRIVPGSAKISYTYTVDDSVTSVAWNGNALGFNPSTRFTTLPYDYPSTAVPLNPGANTLVFGSTNGGNPYGLIARVTLTFDCSAGAVASVPANGPWTLAALAAVLAAAGAGMAKRKRR